MRQIPLRWLMATLFLAVFLLALAAAGGYVYSAMEGVLWGSGSIRMDSHLRYVLGDVDPNNGLDADPRAMMTRIERPVEVPADYEARLGRLATELSGDSFLVALLDAEGRVLARAPEGRESTALPSAQVLASLKRRWERSGPGGSGPFPSRPGGPGRPPWPPSLLPLLFRRPPGPPPRGPLRVVYLATPDRQVLVVPLAREGRLIGFAQMTSSWRFADHMLRSLSASLLLAGAVLALLVCGTGIWLARVLARPLERVAATARRVARGDLAARTGLPEGTNEIYQVGWAFDRMADQVEASFAEQRRFVADASHELKSPLTALVGGAHVLRVLGGDAADPRRQQTLDTMDRELARMEGLVVDLLALSKATEASLQPPSDPVDLRVVVQEALDSALAGAPSRSVEVPEIPEIWILGDQAGLVRALRNLLDNALRYTPPHRAVRVGVHRTASEVRLEVEDEGCGIPSRHLENLGRRFYRADAGRARSSGGTGLGLAIVRAVAERHGGRLEMESQPGQGTRARLVLPLRFEEACEAG